jgi:hypothetical protein
MVCHRNKQSLLIRRSASGLATKQHRRLFTADCVVADLCTWAAPVAAHDAVLVRAIAPQPASRV